MNAFEHLKAECDKLLEAARCPVCKGSGKCDNAEPYGMSMDEWECIQCDGTGVKPKLKPKPKGFGALTEIERRVWKDK